MFFISAIILLSLFIALFRFLKGPTLTDRVIAFDAMGIMSLSLLVVLALFYESAIYLDIALAFGLIGFLGSVVFGRYIEKGI